MYVSRGAAHRRTKPIGGYPNIPLAFTPTNYKERFKPWRVTCNLADNGTPY